MKIKTFAVFGMVFSLAFSCVKPKADDPAPVPTPETPTQKYGNAVMHLHTFVGETELVGYNDDEYEGARGISMSIGDAYLCQFEAVNMLDSVVKISDTLLLKKPDVISYYMSKIPVGKYKSIRFKVGFDTLATHPIQTVSHEPIFPILFHFKGKLDTSAVPDLDNNVRVQYEYKLTGAQRFIEVKLPSRIPGSEFQIAEGRYEYFHIYMDLERLFSGIRINEPHNLQLNESFDANSELGNRLKINVANMFRYE